MSSLVLQRWADAIWEDGIQQRTKLNSPPAIGICERCDAQFKGAGIQAEFDVHKCKPVDSSQNALRIVREATEDK
jgi:hypothetical protein